MGTAVWQGDEEQMAAAVWRGRELAWEQLVDHARAVGPDPRFAGLSDEELDQDVRVQAAAVAAATCRWLELLAEFVVRGIWADQGARTPARWLSWAVGLAPSTARDHVRIGLQLRDLPRLRERFREGTISYSKVRALTRVAVPGTEDMLLRWADAATAAEIERIVAGFRSTQRGKAVSASEREARREYRERHRDDGLVDVCLRVLPEEADEIRTLLERLVDLESAASTLTGPPGGVDGQPTLEVADVPDADRTGCSLAAPPARRATRLVDALLTGLAAAVAAGVPDTSGTDRHTLVVHVDAADVVGEEGPRAVPVDTPRGRARAMDRRTLRRLACEAGIVLVATDDRGTPLDVGRRERRLSAALRRALLARDRSCRFPGCGSTRHLHAHHVHHWADGGPTDLANLVLLCSTHHRFVHEHGWRVEPSGRHRFTFSPPDGAPLAAVGRLPKSQASRHRSEVGVAVDPAALAPCDWAGTGQVDLDLAVAVLDQELRRALPEGILAA